MPGLDRSLQVFMLVAGDAVALESDRTGVAQILECLEEDVYVERAAIEGLDEAVPAVAVAVRAVDGHQEQVRQGQLHQPPHARRLVELQPMAQIEGDAHVRAIDLLGHADRVFHPLDVKPRVRIKGHPDPRLLGHLGDLSHDRHRLGIAVGRGGLELAGADVEPDERPAPFERLDHLGQLGIVLRLVRVEVCSHV